MVEITKEDVLLHRSHGPWRKLESLAKEICQSARTHGGESFSPVLEAAPV